MEVEIGVDFRLPRDDILLSVEEEELGGSGCSVGCPKSVLKAFVLVFDGVVADEVEVDFLGDSEGVFLKFVGRVVDDIEVSGETVTL